MGDTPPPTNRAMTQQEMEDAFVEASSRTQRSLAAEHAARAFQYPYNVPPPQQQPQVRPAPPAPPPPPPPPTPPTTPPHKEGDAP